MNVFSPRDLHMYIHIYIPYMGSICINFHEKKKTFGGLTQSNSIETVLSSAAFL